MPKELTDISAWESKPWFSTGGTRAKKYVESPEGEFYYFKQSEWKPAIGTKAEKDYRYEFWSEIIASRVGKLLGFDVLDYEPALDQTGMGCLCRDMIRIGEEELVGGVQYLQGYDPSFEPALKEHRVRYTFELIERALGHYHLQSYMPRIIEMLVFDAIIGNVDRHQENWAFIQEISSVTKIAQAISPNLKPLLRNKVIQDLKLTERVNRRFSPLFDNGSSLGRELSEERVASLLANPVQLERYIHRSPSEIHWMEGRKPSHFELLELLCKTSHCSTIQAVIDRIRTLFDASSIDAIFASLNNGVPETHAIYRMPGPRKELLVRLITLRCQKLYALLSS